MGKAYRIPSATDRIRKHQLNLKAIEAEIRNRDTPKPVMATRGSGRSGAGATGGGTGNFLDPAGGAMIGAFALSPPVDFSVEIDSDGAIDIGRKDTNQQFSSNIQFEDIQPNTFTLDTITGAAYDGQLLVIRTFAPSSTFTIAAGTLGNGGNIQTPDGTDVTGIGDLQMLFFVFDDVLNIEANVGGSWRLLNTFGTGGSGSQTPWLSDIDADGFDLDDVGAIQYRSGSTLGAASTAFTVFDGTNFRNNTPSATSHLWTVLNADIFSIEGTQILAFKQINLQGLGGISGCIDPTIAQDVATKNYVDTEISGLDFATKALDNLVSPTLNTDIDVNAHELNTVFRLTGVGTNQRIQSVASTGFTYRVNTGESHIFETNATTFLTINATSILLGSNVDFDFADNDLDGLGLLTFFEHNSFGSASTAWIEKETTNLNFNVPTSDGYIFRVALSQVMELSASDMNLNVPLDMGTNFIQFSEITEPADGLVGNSEGNVFFDDTTDPPILKIKKKDSVGAVSVVSLEEGGGSGANTALSNLTNPTAINQSLIPAVNGAVSLGGATLQWGGTNYLNILAFGAGDHRLQGFTVTSVNHLHLKSGTDFIDFSFNGTNTFEYTFTPTALDIGTNDLILAAGFNISKLFFDGGGDTYLTGSATSGRINVISDGTNIVGFSPGSMFVDVDIDMNGHALLLDVDNDTEINSSTDDTMIFLTGGGVRLTLTNSNMFIDSRMIMGEGIDISLGTTTGSKIGLSASEKIGFFGVTPIIQPSTPAANSAAIIAALQTLGLFA